LAAALAPLTAGRRGAGPAAIGVFLLVLFLLMCLGAHLFDRVRTRTFQGWSHLVLEGLAGLGCLVTLGFAVLLFVGVVCAVLLR
jgi:hypothetical protein